ncbi:nuclear transport factor 2 family protein [Frankia sp. Cas3]|uniref:nuclear transport factor 2 family protein n=1 Tax=Frankia sp. Cas3 TaxID=3073926 RepID=UPI002AD1DE63|nr:nuclear transport factor 2 family protein [Frankia sp. Cas3]
MILKRPSPAQAADIVVIQQLAVSYAEAVSRGEVGEAVLAYAPDGVLETPTTAPAVGRDAIEKTISAAVASLEFVFQTVHLGLVNVHDEGHASARFQITEWARRRVDGAGMLFLGYYDDDVVLLPEGWRFSRRRLLPRTLGRPPFLTGAVHDLAALRTEL